MIKRTLIRSAVVIILIAAAALGLIYIRQLAKENTLRIGAVLGISGPAGYGGVDLRDAMALAVEEVNKWGGVNGKRIELIIRDSKCDPAEGVKAFENIEETYHPLLYVSHLSSVSMALAPVAEKHKVAMVALVAVTPELTKDNDWIFRYYSTAEQEIPPAMSILTRLGIRDLGIIYLDDEYGRGVFGLLEEAFEKAGGTIKARAFAPQETVFTKHIAELKDSQALYVVGFGTHMMDIFRQLRQEDFQGPVLATHTATWYPIRQMPESEGIYVSSPIIFNPDFIFAGEMKEKYEARYNRPLTPYAASGYDFIKFLSGVLEDKGPLTRQGVRGLLEGEYIYTGVFGDLELNPKKHEINFRLYPAQIRHGQVKYLD